MFKSFMYLHPLVYESGIRFLYWGGLKNLRPLIAENTSVFEPACGYGRIVKYLPDSCSYRGIDLNTAFIDYGRKKGRNISTGDIFDTSLYPQSDLIILCDILHHLSEDKMKLLIDISLRYSRDKLIIIEPAFVSIASAKNPFSRFLGRVFSIADADGINEIENWLSEEEYAHLFSYIRSSPHVRDMVVHTHHFHYFVEVMLQ